MGPAVEDLANHFNWRPGARRVIFFLGDDLLEHAADGGIQENDKAIQAAKAAHARVYNYVGTGGSERENVRKEYERLSAGTNGKTYTDKSGISWEDVLKDVICTESQAVTGPQTGQMVPFCVMMPMMVPMMCFPMPMTAGTPWGNMVQTPCQCQEKK